MAIALRPARREDAADLARLVDLAGEGLPRHLWAQMAEPGEDVWAVGTRRAARDEGGFSWRNATMAELEGRVAGALVGYPVLHAEPPEEQPPIFQPLQALENEVVGSWYVNVLATYPAFRGRGVATALMAEAERRAAGRDLSLIVLDGNAAAIRLYVALGYREAGRRPLVKDGWQNASEAAVLMVKPAAR